jgi:signal transduction histidine kinase/CheY-like chemotaxis protein
VRKSKLAARLNRIVIGGVLATALGTAAYSVVADRVKEQATLEAYGSEIAALLASSAELGLYTQDPNALERVVRGAVGRSDIAHARILDANSHEIVAKWRNRDAELEHGAHIHVRVPVSSGADRGIEDPLLAAPESDVLGYVELGLSNERATQEGVRGAAASLAIAGLTAIAALLATAVFLRRITQPILDLSAAAQRVAGGDLSYDAPPEAPDEVGDLARSFATMVRRLRDTRDELAAQHGALEQKVEDRTRELAQRTREAEEASRVKSQFLANMSHELRTPLNGVLGMNELLLHSSLMPEQQHYAETVEASGRHLLGIINEVLDFSKAEAGRLEAHVEPCDLHALLRELAEPLRVRAGAKGLRFELDIDADVPRGVATGAMRLRQVVTNLLGNAVKFTDTGSVRMSARAVRGTDRVRIEVHDTGIGIPAAAQARIFEAFTQADGSLSRRYEGTGLGLAISKRVAALLGGEIGLESHVGQGSRFWIELPMPRLTRAELLALDVSRTPPADPEAPARLGLRVLLAEDNPVNQQFALAVLKRLGCEAQAASDGIEAVTAFQSSRFDVILMDGQMPRLDGYQATQEIRALEASEARTPTPIIAVTAHAFEGDRRRAIAAGMNDHLAKPFSLRQLQALLISHASSLGGRSPNGPAPVAPSDAQPHDPIDPAVLDELSALEGEDDPNFVRELMLTFLETAPKLVTALRLALASGDLARAQAAAHTLKSSSAALGGALASSVAGELERRCRDGDTVEALSALACQVADEVERTCARLRELVPKAKEARS